MAAAICDWYTSSDEARLNVLELARAGHLATVHCVEVRCPLPAPLLSAYLGVDSSSSNSRQNNNSTNNNNQQPKNSLFYGLFY